jgi:hypothetical protein
VTLLKLAAYYILVAANPAAAKFCVVNRVLLKRGIPRSWLRIVTGKDACDRATPPGKEGEGKWHVKTQF